MAMIAGRWWKVDAPRSGRFGTLQLHEANEDFPELTLHGEFPGTEHYPEYPVLLGRSSSGEELTLVDCRRTGLRRPIRWGRSAGSEETITCQTVIRKGHVRNPAGPVWTEFTCKFDNLDEWASRVSLVHFKESGSQPDGTHWEDVRLVTPPAVDVRLPTGTVSVWQGASQSFGVDSFTATTETRLGYEPVRPITLEEADEEFVMPMRYFLALATDARTRVREFTAGGPIIDRTGSHNLKRDLDILRIGSSTASPQRLQFEMLLPLAHLGDELERTLIKWFEIVGMRRNAFDLLFSVALGERVFLETRFLLLAQAAEVYHRNTFAGGVLPAPDHERRLKLVLAAAPPEHRAWLKVRLEHGNEPSLKARLDALLEYSALKGRGVLRSKFAREVADTRNYHTHYDPRLKSRAASGASMYWLSEEIRAVLTACLLRDLGFDESATWDRLRPTRLGRALMQQGH